MALTLLHEVGEMGMWKGLVNGQEAGSDGEDNVESGFLSIGTCSKNVVGYMCLGEVSCRDVI